MQFFNIKTFYFLLDILNIEYWQDIIEILLISIPIYYFLIFLKKDKQTNLLLVFYAYISIFFLAYVVPFTTLQPILLITLPIAILLFIVLHEKNIQKNLILSKKIYIPQKNKNENLEDLAKCVLYALNKNKDIIFIIEQESNLKNLIYSTLRINSDLSKDIFEILVQKHICSDSTFILLSQFNSNFKIISINNIWNSNLLYNSTNTKHNKELTWKEKSILVTSKTDAIIFKVNSLTRNFDLIAEGKIINNLNAEKLFLILNKYIKTKDKQKTNKVDNFNKQKAI